MGLAPDRSIIPNQAELNVAFLGCGMMLGSDQSETNKPISLTALGCSQKLKSQRRKTVLSVCCPNPPAMYYLLIQFFLIQRRILEETPKCEKRMPFHKMWKEVYNFQYSWKLYKNTFLETKAETIFFHHSIRSMHTCQLQIIYCRCCQIRPKCVLKSILNINPSHFNLQGCIRVVQSWGVWNIYCSCSIPTSLVWNTGLKKIDHG